ncbi:MAG: cytochrome C oxidase subunit IV family protein [Acidimicrobiaceae bacterium]|nr:cytochrome C oxidase subunit IV family protein [Acidimicrobiaceae bacterium]MCY4280215.1 cytochrome C oxidase subunit IV family protein [Acidimicrobiaceae bacterium]MCY4293603.1 cytochrome C oxidase subunit IV family protein [Acidimicrobiaceae bacterium]
MSETTTTERAAEHAAASSDPSADTEAHSEGHAHPSDWAYVKIALALAVITALEVFTYFESVLDWGVALVPSLLFMMVVKFYLVATWFMHLRFDSKLFGRMFTAGLLLAVGVYVATLAASEFFA